MNKKRFFHSIRVISLILCTAMLLGMFIGCTETTGDDSEYIEYTSTITHTVTNSDSQDTESSGASNTSSGNSGNETSSTTSSNKEVDNVKTEGKTFTLVSSLLPERNSKTKTVFEQLFYKRVEEVEKEYGVKIKVITTLSGYAENVAPLIQAGKMVGNVVETQVRYLPALISAGYIKPWDEIKGIDINNPNFVSGYTNLATFGSKHYGLQFYKPAEVRYCVVMNKTLLANAGIDANNIYSLIEQKKWNYDTLLDYAKKTTDSGKGIYGVGGNPEYFMEMLMNGNNANIVTINSSGKATPTYTDNKIVEALDFMNKLVNVEKVYKTTSTMSKKASFKTPDYISEFVQGKCAFLFEDSWVINQKIRPKVKNFDYGMITAPLGPSGTKYTSSSGHARVFYITSTNKELDFTVKIFNALAETPKGYSGDQWWKDEVQLDYFQNNDKNSLKIYEYSLNNMSFDPGLGMANVFDGFKDAAFGSIFWNSGMTPSAAISSIKGNYDKVINDFFNK